MINFPKIKQFKDIIYDVRKDHDFVGKLNDEPVYEHASRYPIYQFTGTVKLHGTNAAIVRYADGSTKFQSRNRELSIESDNAGFYEYMSGKNIDNLFADYGFNDYMAVFGEWCGGNIQNGVALNQIPKHFVTFAAILDGTYFKYFKSDKDNNIWNIYDIPTYTVEIDFEYPEKSVDTMNLLTDDVEKECPWGRNFGVSGIGEGIVWTSHHCEYIFKTKGLLHRSSSDNSSAAIKSDSVDIIAFVNQTVNNERVENIFVKMVDCGHKLSKKSTGIFLNMITDDILEEEKLSIAENNLDVKSVKQYIIQKAKNMFFAKLDS